MSVILQQIFTDQVFICWYGWFAVKKKNYVAVQLPLIVIQITACYLKSENIDYGNAAANNLM